MIPLRPSVDYLPPAPLRLGRPDIRPASGIPSAHFLFRGLLMAAAVALPVFGPCMTNAPQRSPVSGSVQVAAILESSPLRVAAARFR